MPRGRHRPRGADRGRADGGHQRQPHRSAGRHDRRCEAAAQLGGAVSVYLDGGPSRGGAASTIVDCTDRVAHGAARGWRERRAAAGDPRRRPPVGLALPVATIRIGISGLDLRAAGAGSSTRRAWCTGRELAYAAERLRLDRDQRLVLLPAAARRSYRSWRAQTPDGLRVRGQGRPVHHAHEEARRRRDGRSPTSSPRASWRSGRSSARCCGSCRRSSASTPTGSRPSSTCCPAPPRRRPGSRGGTTTGSPSDRALTATDADRPLRHALEVRHARFVDAEAFTRCCATTTSRSSSPTRPAVAAARARSRPTSCTSACTATRSCTSAATPPPRWTLGRADPARGPADGQDVYVYFDNDVKVHAPYDALGLMERLGLRGADAPPVTPART